MLRLLESNLFLVSLFNKPFLSSSNLFASFALVLHLLLDTCALLCLALLEERFVSEVAASNLLEIHM